MTPKDREKMLKEILPSITFENNQNLQNIFADYKNNCLASLKNEVILKEELERLKGFEWDIIHRGKSFIGIFYYYTNGHRNRKYKNFKCNSFMEAIEQIAHEVQQKRLEDKNV